MIYNKKNKKQNTDHGNENKRSTRLEHINNGYSKLTVVNLSVILKGNKHAMERMSKKIRQGPSITCGNVYLQEANVQEDR